MTLFVMNIEENYEDFGLLQPGSITSGSIGTAVTLQTPGTDFPIPIFILDVWHPNPIRG